MTMEQRSEVDAWLDHHDLKRVVACEPLDESGRHLLVCTHSTTRPKRVLVDMAEMELVLTTFEFHADYSFPPHAWRYAEGEL